MTDTIDTPDKDGLGSQLWVALRNALTEEDPIAAARRAKLPGGKAPAALTVRQGATPDEMPLAAVPAAMSPMAKALLEQVLAKATAYTALTDKLTPLEAIIVDERTRYQAAYALIKGSRSVEQVLQSIDMQHLQALEAEAGRFAAQLQDKERAEIGTRSAEAQSLTAAIDNAAQQVARLRQDVETRIAQIESMAARDRERLAVVTREIDDKRRELDGVQQQFDSAAKAVRDTLGAAKDTVLRHLG
jgi:chromosome segregation ATPase